MIPNKNGIREYSNEPIDSDFKMIFKETSKGKNTKKFWNEKIKYHSKFDNKDYTYTQPLGETICAIMNNYEEILHIISKYDGLLDEIEYEDFDEALDIILKLREEIIKYGEEYKRIEKNRDLEEYNQRSTIKKYNRTRTNKIFLIFIFHIDSFIEELKNEKENNIEGPRVSCINFLQYLKCVLSTSRYIVDKAFVKTYTEDGKINISSKRYMDLNQLKIPPVKIMYSNSENTQSQRKQIDRFEYEIYSLENFIDVSLYHIHYNRKAILKCLNCNRFFIPSVYETEKYNEETGKEETKNINERITKLTCSEKCQQDLRENRKFMNNNMSSKEKRKKIRDKLRKRDNTRIKKGLEPKDYLLLFDNEYDIQKEKMEEKYNENKIKIEYELRKILEEEEIRFDRLYNKE